MALTITHFADGLWYMDVSRAAELDLPRDDGSLDTDVLSVLHHDLRRAVDDQYEQLRNLRLTAAVAAVVSIGTLAVLLPPRPLDVLSEAALVPFLLCTGFAALVLLPTEHGGRWLTLVSLRRFDSTASGEAMARRLVDVARSRMRGNEPLIRRRSLFLRLTLIALVAEIVLLTSSAIYT